VRLGIDPGSARIGVARSDPDGLLASPLATVPRGPGDLDRLVAIALEPIVSAIAATVHEMLSEIPAGLAEDVVRGKVRLAGGGALLPGLASRIETAAGIGTVLVDDPMRCVIRGAAEILERKDKGERSGPGLRQ